jgi:hypothetical protein
VLKNRVGIAGRVALPRVTPFDTSATSGSLTGGHRPSLVRKRPQLSHSRQRAASISPRPLLESHTEPGKR